MSNRYWSSAPNDNRTAPSLPYIFDANAINSGVIPPITGNWRPYTTTDIPSSNVSVSGLSLSINSVGITGNPIVTTTGVLPVLFSPSNTVSNSIPSGANGLALTANSNRKYFFIQNNATGSSPLFIRFDGPASTQQYNIILNPASAQWAGDGGSFDDENRYVGNLYVSGLNIINYICWELT